MISNECMFWSKITHILYKRAAKVKGYQSHFNNMLSCKRTSGDNFRAQLLMEKKF